jgi:hypothetical protein
MSTTTRPEARPVTTPTLVHGHAAHHDLSCSGPVLAERGDATIPDWRLAGWADVTGRVSPAKTGRQVPKFKSWGVDAEDSVCTSPELGLSSVDPAVRRVSAGSGSTR